MKQNTLSGNVVVANDLSELEDLRTWCDSFGNPGGITAIPRSGETVANGCRTKLSFTKGKQGPSLEDVTLVSIGETAGPWINQLTKVEKTTLPQATKVAVRFTAPIHYRKIFLDEGKTKDTPNQVVAAVAAHAEIKVSDLLGGNWSHQQSGTGTEQLVGYLRLRPEVWEAILPHSGTKAVFFTKVGDRSGDSPHWVRGEKTEAKESYFRRVLALQKNRKQPLPCRRRQ